MRSIYYSSLIIIFTATLAGCGSQNTKFTGQYVDDRGFVSYSFQANGTVLQTIGNVSQERPYTIQQNRIEIGPNTPPTILIKLEDGNMVGPMGIILRQQTP